LHYAEDNDKDHNIDADHIANVKENCEGKYIKVVAENDGSFTLTNSRTGAEKTYAKK
jgi:ATP-dependent 26S proteasome regulatory subunit